MHTTLLNRSIELSSPPDRVFAFFASAENLERLTPPWLRFEVKSALPIEMVAGAEIDYALRLRGIPIQWRSRITIWEPPHRFVDEQIRGPYRLWVHEHQFEESNGGTLVSDRVRYSVPGGPVIDRLFVARDLRLVFDYRHEVLRGVFEEPGGAS